MTFPRFVLCCALLVGCAREEPLPQMLPIGRFSLTDQNGAAFGTDQLRGKVWIADFVFTSCPDVCPVLTTQMANLHRRIDDADVRFVSITVDPVHDTPEQLRTYASRFGVRGARWKFLTGSPADVRRVVQDRFRAAVGDRAARDDGRYSILHGMRFVLVDREGTMRGLYETDAEGLEQLEHDVERLLAE